MAEWTEDDLDYPGRQLEGDLTDDEEKVVKALLIGVQRVDIPKFTGVDHARVLKMIRSDWIDAVVEQRETRAYTSGRRLAAVAYHEAIGVIINVMRDWDPKTKEKLGVKIQDRLRAAEKIAQLAMDGEDRAQLRAQLKRIEAHLADNESELDNMTPSEQFDIIMKKYTPKLAAKRGQS